MQLRRLMVCFGTRPEAIKMAPLVGALGAAAEFELRVCVTAQHRRMLDQVLELFGIVPDHDLDLMSPGQTLPGLTGAVVGGMTGILERDRPDAVIVQGDTTTTFAVALAAFYERIPVAHVEAGLRTYDRYSPFPEEINRRLTSALAQWHFAPTPRARQALLDEGVPEETVFLVGNTVVDALLSVVEKARASGLPSRPELARRLAGRRFILVTGHRRESFGEGFKSICAALARLAEAYPEVDLVYPVHLNPNVQRPVRSILGAIDNVHLLEPLDYLEFVWLMDACHLILTDSGGVQEEAPSLNKPVLVMRDTTERLEAIEAGVARLVGCDADLIVAEASRLLEGEDAYDEMSGIENPYGDGTSAERIAAVLRALQHGDEALDAAVAEER